MKIKHILQSGIKSLMSAKGRSALTILGIVIGITAIMLIFSLGAGAQRLITSQFESLGAKVLFLGSGRGFGEGGGRSSEGFTQREIEFLQNKSNLPFAKNVMPLTITGAKISYEDKIKQGNIQGGGEATESIFGFIPEYGSFFTQEDVLGRAQVVVLGYKLAQEIFGSSEEALGKRIKIKETNFTVIGVLPLKGQTAIFGIDNNALMPMSSLQQYISGDSKVNNIIIEVTDEKYANITEENTKDALYFLRDFDENTDPEKIDFNITNQQSLINTVSTILGGFSLFLTSVAAISLIVGGIGIMNIMLVSVSERTREIGLRKSLGATNKDISRQFIFEATLLTGIGGLIGSLFGALLSYLISIMINSFTDLLWVYTFPFTGMIIGILVSLVIGIVFGSYPAKKAAQKSPTEALRYE